MTPRDRLDVLLDALADLRRYRDTLDLARLEHDRDASHMVLHALYIAAQAAIDLALHAAARRELASAATYQEVFRRLGEAGLVERSLAERLTGWAGLRNVLAHLYAEIDYTAIARALKEELGDLERFAVAAAEWIERDGGGAADG